MSEVKPLTREGFRSRFRVTERFVTIPSTGDVLKVKSLNMSTKRDIRESNMTAVESFPIKTVDAGRSLHIEGYMVDTIMAACIEPKFSEEDKLWMLENADGSYIQEIYALIDSPVKLMEATEASLGK